MQRRFVAPAIVMMMLASDASLSHAASCNGKTTIGYFTAWGIYDRNFQVTDIDAGKLTHVNYAFSNIDGATLTCTLGDAWADVDKPYAGDCPDPGCLRGNFHQIKKLKQANPGLKAMISVGGWTWSEHFSDAALTAASRQRLVRSCVDLYLRGEFGPPWGTHAGVFDGIDIDWEYPVGGGLTAGRPEDRLNYTLLMQEFRAQLDALSVMTGSKYELSIAAGAGSVQLSHLDIPGLSQVLDHINLMTYDFSGPWDAITNFNAPLLKSLGDPRPNPDDFCIDGAVSAFLAAGAPPEKLVLGLPFYGASWSGVSNSGNGLYQTATGPGPGTFQPGTLDYWDIQQNYRPVYSRFDHPEAKAPWLFNGTTFISFDDPGTIASKARYVLDHGLAGAMFWELSGDLKGVPAPAGSLLAAFTGELCAPPPLPGRIVDLTVTRNAGDLLLGWRRDPLATGGYHLYSTNRKDEVGSLRADNPPALAFATLQATDALPFRYAGGLVNGLAYYQVLGVAADGLSEGPN